MPWICLGVYGKDRKIFHIQLLDEIAWNRVQAQCQAAMSITQAAWVASPIESGSAGLLLLIRNIGGDVQTRQRIRHSRAGSLSGLFPGLFGKRPLNVFADEFGRVILAALQGADACLGSGCVAERYGNVAQPADVSGATDG